MTSNLPHSPLTTAELPDSKHSGNLLFPVFLKMEQLQLAIIGGGPVALEKLQAVLHQSPETHIALTAMAIHEGIHALAAKHPNLELHEKPYEPEDLDAAQVVMVAVNNLVLSEQIRQDAHARGLLVNVADTPLQCDFYLGSIVKKGDLKLAISTNGKSPTMAKRLRETLDDALPAEMDELLQHMQAIRNQLKGDFTAKVKALNEVTRTLGVKDEDERSRRWQRVARWSLIIFASMLIGHFILSYIPFRSLAAIGAELYGQLGDNFHWIVLAGFLAQLIDGSLGMGYGITSATILMSAGVPPASISGSIHTAEMFASGASGYSHYRFGNVNKKLFRMLVIPGVLGSILGAVLLVYLGEKHLNYVRPVMAAYTLVLGFRFIWNAFKHKIPNRRFKHYRALAGAGGFLDSFGGGGWGPIVTSTLINRGRNPKYVIGTVSLTEFFVTLSSAFTFFTLIGISHWQVILALITGSLIGAPLGARLAGRMPRRTAFLLLGILVIIWSMRILVKII